MHSNYGSDIQSTNRVNISYGTSFGQLKMFDTPETKTGYVFAVEACMQEGVIIGTNVVTCQETRMPIDEFFGYIHERDIGELKKEIQFRPGQSPKRVDVEFRMSAGGILRKNKLKGILYDIKGHGYLTGLVFDVEHAAEQAAKLEYYKKFDVKSGLANAQMLDATFAETSKYGMYPQTLIVADIDRFKDINDSLGYNAGNALIKNVADVLKGVFFDSEIFARICGGEYCAVYAGKSSLEIEHKIKEAQMLLHGMYLNLIKAEVSFGYAVSEKQSDFSALYSQSMQILRRERNTRKVLSGNSIIDNINRGIEKRVNWGKRHTRLQGLSLQIANNLGCGEQCISTLKVLSRIADLGLIAIDTALIKNRTSLSGQESETYKSHVGVGKDIIASINEVAEYEGLYIDIFKRYDRWQDAIALPSRILAGVIEFDDLMSAFPDLSFSKIKEKFLEKRNKQCCPTVIDAILAVAEKHYE